jgi:ferrous iron transport protein B
VGRSADGLDRAATSALGEAVGALLPDGLLRSLLVDGIVAGVGGVLVFLPQIVILFFFILLLEESGYLPRAAFLLDRLMGGVGLSGRSFIPLLSSFACAIPGIMATRTIQNPRDRWVTIMIAPLMTCSARLPVYALLIGAFIPARSVAGGLNFRGWCCLRSISPASCRDRLSPGWSSASARATVTTLMMELPDYHWPSLRNLAIGLWQRVLIFLQRVGGMILAMTLAAVVYGHLSGSARPAPPGLRSSTAVRACSVICSGRVRTDRLQLADIVALVPGWPRARSR